MTVTNIPQKAVVRQSTKPTAPQAGLLWYDTSAKILKQYKDGSFVNVSSNVDGETLNQNQSGELQVNRPLAGNKLIKLVSMQGFSADGKNDGDFYTSGENNTEIYCNTDYDGNVGDEQNCVKSFNSLGSDADLVKVSYSYDAAPGGYDGKNPGEVEIRINGNTEVSVTNTDNDISESNSGTIIFGEYNAFSLDKIFLYAKSGAVEEAYGNVHESSSVQIEAVELVNSKSKEVVG